jgi:phage protein U
MYAILGEYKFRGYKGVQDLTLTDETIISQHAVIEGKPKIQATGEKLREITIKFLLHSTFSNPEEDLEILQGYRRRSEVVKFVAGNGTNYGNFVITSITQSLQQTDNSGRIIGVNVDVSLLEATGFDTKKVSSSDKLATKLPEVDLTPLLPKPSDPRLVALNIKTINVQSNAMHRELTDAQKIAAKTERALRQAKKRIALIKDALIVIEGVGSKTTAIVNMYGSIQGQVATVGSATNTLGVFVDNGDLNSSVNASSQLRNTVSKLRVDSAPISNLTGVRKNKEPVQNGTILDFDLNGTF